MNLSKLDHKFTEQNILMIVLFLGLIFRLIKYFALNDLSHDEAIGFFDAINLSYSDHFFKNSDSSVLTNPFLFFFISKIKIAISENIYFIKLIPFLLSVLNLIVFYKIYSLVRDELKLLTLVVITVFSLNTFFIQYSNLFLTYSYILFIVSLMIYNYLSYNEENSDKYLYTISFLSLIGLFIDYSIVWFLLPFGLFTLTNPKKYKKIIIFNSISIGIFFIWIGSVFSSFFHKAIAEKSVINSVGFDKLFIFENISWFYNLDYINIYLFICVFLIIIILSIISIKKLENKEFKIIISLVAFLPLAITIIATLFGYTIVDYKNLWISNLCLLTLSIYFLCKLNKKFILLFILYFITIDKYNFLTYQHLMYQDSLKLMSYKDVLIDINNRAKGQNIIIYHNDREFDPLRYYSRTLFKNRFNFVNINEDYIANQNDNVFFLFIIEDNRKDDLVNYNNKISALNCNIEKIARKNSFYKYEKCN